MSSPTSSTNSQSLIQAQIEALGKDFLKRELPEGPTSDLEWIDVASLPVAQRMAVQEQARNPVLMMIQWLWNALCSWISNQFHAGRNQYNRDLLFLCHCLKNQGHISFKQFLELNDCVGSRDDFSRKIEALVNELYKNRFIDKRGRRHLIALLAKNELKEVLLYLNTVSVLNTLNANIEDVKQVINPREALQVSHELRMAFENSIFDPKASAHLHSILARVQIARWIEGIDASAEIKEGLLSSVKKGNRAEFTSEAKALLLKLSEETTSKLHAHYYHDLAKSFDQPIHEDPFLHFAHGLTTEGIVASWQKNFEDLSRSIGHASQEEIETIKPQLKRLYAIFGHMLHQEQKFTISSTAYSHTYGVLRRQWEKINDAISLNAPATEGHIVCGCNHHTGSTGVGPWPDTATTVTRPGNYTSDTHRVTHPKLKAMITTCSWGAGHQSAASAVRDYLGKSGFHTTAIDVPQEVLLSEDTVNNIFGGDYSITKLYNTVVAGEHFGFLDFLAKVAGGDPTQAQVASEVEKKLVRDRVLKERPDILISVYPRQNHIIAEVAEELGIPFLFINTDLDCNATSNERCAQYPHFTTIVPNGDLEVLATLHDRVPMDRVKPLGYPVRPQFMQPPPPEKIAELRAELGAEEDEKIILVMNGGCGSKSPWTEEIIKAMKAGELDKCHVVSVCGRNEALKKDLEELLVEYPELAGKIHIKGYVQAEDMAKLMYASHALVTKPGGATTAEAIQTKTNLVMFHLNGGVPWEKFTSDWVISQNMGSSFSSKRDFLPALKKQLETEFPENPDVQQDKPQEVVYVDLVHEMIGKALADPECIRKQRQWRSDVELPAMKPLSAEGRRLASAQLALKSQLGRISDSFRLSIPDETLNGLRQGKSVRINHQTGQLELSDHYDEKEMSYVLQRLNALFTDWEVQDEDISSENHTRVLLAAASILECAKAEHKSKLDQGLSSANRKNSHIMQIATLDRLLVAMRLRNQGISLERFEELFDLSEEKRSDSIDAVSKLFVTQVAKDQYRKWCSEQVSSARRHQTQDPLLTLKDATLSFMYRPSSTDFIQRLHLHRKTSTFDHHIRLNEAADPMILMDGVLTPARELAERFEIFQQRIVEKETGKEHFYHFNKGLIEGSHDLWRGTLPVYKVNPERKTKDYRMEIMSCVGKENHSWIRLKDPEGNVISAGKFWDKDVDIPGVALLTALPGSIHIGDVHEYMGHEGINKRTVLPLTEVQYKRIKRSIQIEQARLLNEDEGYNLISENCTTFVRRMAKMAGHDINTQAPLFYALFNPPNWFKRLYNQSLAIRWISTIVFYPLLLIKNIFAYLLGGGFHDGDSGLRKARVFNNIWEVFDPRKGMVDHPIQVHAWQEEMEERAASQARHLPASIPAVDDEEDPVQAQQAAGG